MGKLWKHDTRGESVLLLFFPSTDIRFKLIATFIADNELPAIEYLPELRTF